MSAMGEMPMPGGWTMSMAWMRSWPVASMATRASVGAPSTPSSLAYPSASSVKGVALGLVRK
jgi:hypothetical protein